MECRYCSRKYQRKGPYEKHVNMCRILHIGDHPVENDEIPTIKQMYELIQQLVVKNNALEKKVEKLTILNSRRLDISEKISILSKPDQSFAEWCDSIVLDRSHLNLIYEHGHVDGLMMILSQFISNTIRGFYQKDNLLYIYDDKWRPITEKEYTEFIGGIKRQIINLAAKYRHEDSLKVHEYVEKMKEVYNLMDDSVNHSIKIYIYTTIKQTI